MGFKPKIFSNNKIVIGYVIVIVLFVTLMIFTMLKFTDMARQEVSQIVLKSLKQLDVNITSVLKNMESLSNVIYANPDLSDCLRGQGESSDYARQISEEKTLTRIIGTANSIGRSINIKLFVNDTKLYANENVTFFNMNTAGNYPWYDKVIENEGRLYWQDSYVSNGRRVIAATRVLKDIDNYKNVIGILCLELEADEIFNIISGFALEEGHTLVIVDETGKNIFDSSEMLDESIVFPKGQTEGIMSISNSGETNFIIFTQIDDTDWKLVYTLPQNRIKLSNVSFYSMSMLLFLFILIATIFFAFAVTYNMLNKRMLNIISKLNGEENAAAESPSGSNVFQILDTRAEKIVLTLKQTIEYAYQAKVQEHNARLSAFQAQINPHFLYNTLESINWMAVEYGATDVSAMIDSLSKYFRLMLSKGRDIVTIENEIELLRAYIDLQLQRYKEKFEIEFDLDDEVLQYKLPKLTLQPVLENALTHSTKNTNGRTIRIVIAVRAYADGIEIEIADDGCGMEEEFAATLTEKKPKYDNYSNFHYGIYNVLQRLNIFCGDYIEAGNYGMVIVSKPNEGTRVIIRMKKHS